MSLFTILVVAGFIFFCWKYGWGGLFAYSILLLMFFYVVGRFLPHQ